MPNKTGKKKCSKCGTPGHQATTCRRTAVPPPGPKTKPFQMKNRGQARKATARAKPAPITGASAPGDFAVAKGRESAKAVIQTKIREELAWARSYVAELERLAGEA